MKKKIILWFILLMVTGYVLDYGFKAMNLKSDLSYIAGAVGIVLWLLLLFFIYGKTTKKKEIKSNDETKAVDASDSVDSPVSMYDSDRTGDGRN